ncbi:MAG TPA: hypothetical protein VF230_18800 [Acidimicrobiales bacterium]
MRRWLIALVLVASMGLAPAPAAADTDVCVGQANFDTTPPLTYTSGVAAQFNLNTVIGGCPLGGSIYGLGRLTGLLGGATCAQFHTRTGTSAANDGSQAHHFELTAAASLAVVGATLDGPHAEFVPSMLGVMQIVPNATAGASCATGASNFIATYVLVPVTGTITCPPQVCPAG